MTYKEAADILDPETRIEALVEIGYYNGFNSDKAQSDAVNEACRIAAEVLRTATDTNVSDKWVSVKDRMPDVIRNYIVATKEKYKSENKWITNSYVSTYNPFNENKNSTYIVDGVWDFYDDIKEGQETHVTHWMEIPEPPESEE